uniref:Segregation and condensation protein A n=2 Tax=environmental samples TaxID=68359 RepID=A0A075HUV8_9EURY|nr:segregation and condensation protein A [uncultured marine group II/III euryarchaeote KM3_05_F04]AIF20141.1 segregation and condensation protein A [uncultured marine group II/III euryarchaeote KM3_88_E02]
MNRMATLDALALRDDIISAMIGHDDKVALNQSRYADHIQELAEMEQAEHQALVDPFDRSVALVLQMFNSNDLDPWDINLETFIELFNERMKDAENIDLPTCGRLIRMAWQVLHGQASSLLDRAERADQWEEDDWDYMPGWQTEYGDDEFAFTTSILSGEASDSLPELFDGRIKRDAGRPVTLAELLGCLAEAHEEAEERQIREASRVKHAAQVENAIANVTGRLHQENQEEEMRTTWQAIRELSPKGEPVTVQKVAELLKSQGIALGFEMEDAQTEGDIVGFVSALFLTHRGYTDIWQVEYPNGDIFLQDKWPNLADFEEVSQKLAPEVAA